MKSVILAIIGVILFSAAPAANTVHENVEVKQDKAGKIEIASTSDITQVKCFNEEGRKLLLNVSDHKKNLHLANKLEKGVWYFQVKTISGQAVFQKVVIQ